MNKLELVAAIAELSGLTKTDSEKALNAFTSATKKTLHKGESIQLVGFGTFSVTQKAARTGKNPRTGAAIQIPAKKVAKFKAGKALADSI